MNPMTRLNRVLNLLKEYEDFIKYYMPDDDIVGYITLECLRLKKEKLTQELIEHGCRRKN
jgi:hypothetical protein